LGNHSNTAFYYRSYVVRGVAHQPEAGNLPFGFSLNTTWLVHFRSPPKQQHEWNNLSSHKHRAEACLSKAPQESTALYFVLAPDLQQQEALSYFISN
jgi:hypothetical protein